MRAGKTMYQTPWTASLALTTNYTLLFHDLHRDNFVFWRVSDCTQGIGDFVVVLLCIALSNHLSTLGVGMITPSPNPPKWQQATRGHPRKVLQFTFDFLISQLQH
ncbi:hypothetical protein O3P69_004175 [Scylla paramamosain]|uniref:Uncharacterized protein n=1 Tax=Scylla paramamosain TaxID=85552 RepID=A0AAW0UFG5_SCYPA